MSFKMRSVITVLTTAFVLSFRTPVQAQTGLQCTNQLLRGSYSSHLSGFLNSTIPFTFQALDIFDGNGNVQGTNGVTSIGGQVTTNQSFTGTYKVNSDCTVNFSFTDNSSGQKFAIYGVIFDNGNQVSDIDTDQGTNLLGTVQRVRYRIPYPSY